MSKNLEKLSLLKVIETDSLNLKIEVTEDKLKLFLSGQKKPETPGISAKELVKLLSPIAHPETFHHQVLSDIADQLNKGQKIEGRRIAKGIPPAEGRDGGALLWSWVRRCCCRCRRRRRCRCRCGCACVCVCARVGVRCE